MANKRKMTTNEYVRSLPPKDPKDIAVGILLKENRKNRELLDTLKLESIQSIENAKKESDELMMAKVIKYENEIAMLKKNISELEQQLLTAQNDADANRAMANIPQY
jgi:hypothetical protein